MKRFIILVLIGLLALSCRSLPFLGSVGEAPATEVGEGGTDTSGYFLADPKAGLEGLQSYTASLVITFSGTQDGQPLAFSDSYRQEVNQQSGTRFTWSSVTGMDGAVTETVTGKVGEAYYTRLQGGKCNVSWGSRAEGVEPFIPASLLPLVPAAKETSQQELDGLPATRGTVDAASLGFPGGVEADGKVWLADQGGAVLKYSRHIRGGKEYFGEGVEGEQSFEYKLSQVNAGIEPELPEGCLPVLMEIPAMADAYSLSRLPGVLAYSSASTPAAITEFYTGELPAMGWTQVGAHKGTDGSTTTVYVNEAQDQTLTIILQVVEGETWVTVHTEPLEAPMPAFMP